MPKAISKTGNMVEFMPTARPLMMQVAGPVLHCSAMLCTGLNSALVARSVSAPMAMPITMPMATATNGPFTPKKFLPSTKAAARVMMPLR